MKIARVILDLNKSKFDIYNRYKKNPWENHQKALIKLFTNNKDKYIERIKNIIEMAYKYKVEVVIFPACTFIYNKRNELLQYFSFNKRVLISSGSLKVNKNNKTSEGALIISNKKIIKNWEEVKVENFTYKNICFFLQYHQQ